jgi:hypothetical protein
MAAIKPVEQSAEKWQRRAQVAGPDYQAGVQNPRQSWAQAAAAADANYRQGVTAAATAGRFAAGVRKAGDERWRANALAKGPSRFGEGVTLAVGEWQRGFAPYQAAIASLQLPARGPAGSPQNLQRVQAVANLLRQVKERGAGGAAR